MRSKNDAGCVRAVVWLRSHTVLPIALAFGAACAGDDLVMVEPGPHQPRVFRRWMRALVALSTLVAACSDKEAASCEPGYGDEALAASPTVFVSAACGSDDNSGLAPGRALATLAAAADIATASDVVAIGEGSYGGGAVFTAGVKLHGAGAHLTTLSHDDGPGVQFRGGGTPVDAAGHRSELHDVVVADCSGAGVQGKGTDLLLEGVGVVRTLRLAGKGGHGVQLVAGGALELENCAVIGNAGAGVLAADVGSVSILDPHYIEAGGVRVDVDEFGTVDPSYEPSDDAPAPADNPTVVIAPSFSPVAVIDPAFIIDPAFAPGTAGGASIVDPYYAPAGIIDPAFSPRSDVGANGAGGVAIIDPALAARTGKHDHAKTDAEDATLIIDATTLRQNVGFGVVVNAAVPGLGEKPQSVLIRRSAIVATLAPASGGIGGGDGVVVEGASLVLEAQSVVALSQRAGIALHDASADIASLVSFSARGGVWADGEVTQLVSGDDLRVMGNAVVGMLIENGAEIAAIGGVVDRSSDDGGEGGEGIVIRDQAHGSLSKMTLKSTAGAAVLVDDPATDEQGGPDVNIEDCAFEDVDQAVVIKGAGEGGEVLAGEIGEKNSFQSVGEETSDDAGYVGPGSLCVSGCSEEGVPAPGPDGSHCADASVDSDADGVPDCDEQAACPPGAEQTNAVAPGKAETCDQLDNDCDGVIDEGCDCPPNTFGTTCVPCSCGDNASCDDGPVGTGACTCDPGWSGPPGCESCAKGWAGENCDSCALGYGGADCGACAEGFADGPAGACDVCADGYFGEACQKCSCGEAQLCADGRGGDGVCSCPPGTWGVACTACDCGVGTCDEGLAGGGSCSCGEGWGGESCGACADGYYGAACEPCDCDHGSCADGLAGDGACTCDVGWGGESCGACADGYFGPSCAACGCGDKQACADGLEGDGACTCADGWVDVDGDGEDGSGGNGCECGIVGDETCGNDIDDDCDGKVDDLGAVGCTPLFADADQDGFGVGKSTCGCKAVGLFVAVTNGDCDDANAAANPDGTETCNGFDDDCDGVTDDEGAVACAAFHLDGDGDGWGVADDSKCLCAGVPPYNAVTPTDCNDADPTVSPGAGESCNGVDDDCDSDIDEPGAIDCFFFFRDDDDDTFGVAGDSKCLCQPVVPFNASVAGDCDDGNPNISPVATELCDGVDNDCAGGPDDPFTDLGDGCTAGTGVCATSGVIVCHESELSTICNATPGVGADGESCNALDDDCDGETDEGFPDLGEPCSAGIGACAVIGAVACGADGSATECDATPGAPGAELCDGNGIDEDCDGEGDLDDLDAAAACNDGNSCTQDVCQLAGCANPDAPAGAPCSGADLCELGECVTDTCDLGQLQPVACDDENPCTVDSCDPALGCVSDAVADGTPCDEVGTCLAGTCDLPPCAAASFTLAPGPEVVPLTKLVFDASASSVTDGGGVDTFSWALNSAPPGAAPWSPSSADATPSYTAALTGQYEFCLTVTGSDGASSCGQVCESVIVVPSVDLYVELTWETPGDPDQGDGVGSDLDLHLASDMGFDQPDQDGDGQGDPWFSPKWDVYWLSPKPDWGAAGGSDDPALIIDDVNGLGPEAIEVANAPGGVYTAGVHYWGDQGFGSSTATVRIYMLGGLVYEISSPGLEVQDMWQVARVSLPAGTVEACHVGGDPLAPWAASGDPCIFACYGVPNQPGSGNNPSCN